MANENIYQSEFTGQQMDAKFTAVATLSAAITALELAVAAKYSKPATGIPATDLDADVNAALAKANSAIQSLADYYTKSEVDAMMSAVNSQEYETAATLPTASASTMGKIYLIGPDGSGYYSYYFTSYDGSDYSWVGPLGTTEISLAGYASKAELSQLDQEINGVSEERTFTSQAYATTSDYGVRYASGVLDARNGWYASGYLPVIGGSTLKFKAYNATNYGIAFYSAESESAYISGEKSTGSEVEILVPSAARYCRFCDYTEQRDGYVKYQVSSEGLIDKVNTLDGKVATLEDRVDSMEPALTRDSKMSDVSDNAVKNNVIKKYVDDVTGYPVTSLPSNTDGYTLDGSGKLVTNAYVTARGVTDFLPVSPGKNIFVKSGAYQGGNANYCWVAFYASANENDLVSVKINIPYATEITNTMVVVPDGAAYARFVLMDKTVPVILSYDKTLRERIEEIQTIAKNYGKNIVVFGGSHTARENSEAAKNIWRDKLGMDVFTAGVGSCGIVAGVNMSAWKNGTEIYYTRTDFNDGVGSRVWDSAGFLSYKTVTALGDSSITLSDGVTYQRDATQDYFSNAQTQVARQYAQEVLDKDVYVIWLSTNDYVQAIPVGTFRDYSVADNYDTSKIYQGAGNIGTLCGGLNYIIKTIRNNRPSAEIYVFASLRFFNAGARGYDPYTEDANSLGINFYEYQQEAFKAAQVAGCAILDQFMLEGVDIANYATFYESDALHLKVAGYEKIGYIQADFLANGK